MSRRTPVEIAADNLATAQAKVEKIQQRVKRLSGDYATARAALAKAETERDYAAAHPLLKPAEAVTIPEQP